ncbi:response regulator transcription factor [Nitrosococcus watsonii]|uniref:Two component transcriptional regulator, LuxR family n=1 Tax=Nitrosococcus watsoni (strain C-113) TaxID=105559 RepID=D8KBN3_NITWC|nr:response regulator [Nitrosococcus watsonii]ADJ27644.1 two component transcriptional regulator, LuxR family [Nitrosococcus watsonii C-113]
MEKAIPQATVFIVDDDEAVRDSLCWVIKSAEFKVKAYASAEEFLEQWESSQPGCLVLDVQMPEMSGLQLQKLLAKKDNLLPIIFVSAHGRVPDAVSALREGAVDFLTKPFDHQTLMERIQNSLELDRRRRERRQEQEEIAQRMAQLTARERQVMELIGMGKANKVVAIELGISTKTVEIHRARVMEKLEVRNLAALIHLIRFWRNGDD